MLEGLNAPDANVVLLASDGERVPGGAEARLLVCCR